MTTIRIQTIDGTENVGAIRIRKISTKFVSIDVAPKGEPEAGMVLTKAEAIALATALLATAAKLEN